MTGNTLFYLKTRSDSFRASFLCNRLIPPAKIFDEMADIHAAVRNQSDVRAVSPTYSSNNIGPSE